MLHSLAILSAFEKIPWRSTIYYWHIFHDFYICAFRCDLYTEKHANAEQVNFENCYTLRNKKCSLSSLWPFNITNQIWEYEIEIWNTKMKKKMYSWRQ